MPSQNLEDSKCAKNVQIAYYVKEGTILNDKGSLMNYYQLSSSFHFFDQSETINFQPKYK